eukprot:gene24133-biopygen9850
MKPLIAFAFVPTPSASKIINQRQAAIRDEARGVRAEDLRMVGK